MSRTFQRGETVLLSEGERSYLVRLVEKMGRIRGTRGAVSLEKIVGLKEGDTMSIGTKEFRLFRPDICDILEGIERGPQLITTKDSARLVQMLSLRSGSKVVEGGAGSGALTIMILNSVWSEGSVTTYELRNDHLNLARRNINLSGMNSIWEGKTGDIREGIPESDMDAFVVDIPDPEACVDTALNSLRIGGRFAGYVPTINQMERLSLALEETGFSGVRAEEILLRGYNLKKGAMRPSTEMVGHTGFLIYARRTE